jgi:HSP90 family molecular chaperone
MQKGSIRVQTENIFPIIKKFLYSDHEIFIRELVSNAVDATQKLKTLSSIGEAKGEIGETNIEVKIDKEKKTLTISDRGVGMTAEEVDKYLNQVAFSGAEEFLEKLKELFKVEVPEMNVSVEVKGLNPDTPPVIATRPEFMRRMKDMAQHGGGGMGSFYGNMPEEVTLTVNGNHPVYKNILKSGEKEIQEKQVRNLTDLALLSQGLLKGSELTNFINRSVDMMQGEKKGRIIVDA